MRSLPILLAGATLVAAPAALADTGGASAPGGVAVDAAAAGGAQYGARAAGSGRPVAQLSVATPIREGGDPRIRVRFDEPGERFVVARLVVLRIPGNAPVARIALGRVRTGRSIAVHWPHRAGLAAGQYLVRVHARDRAGHQLRRLAHASGKSTLVVSPRPAPAPAPAPAPTPSPVSPPPVASASGVFPVAGPYTYGEPFGAPRKGYSHQGQDIAAAAGTPIVAPLAGTIRTAAYQASAAGEYLVLDAADGSSYFFAHCQRNSTAVTTGQAVSAGTLLCRVGSTGDATGPHLHFEQWVGGWRANAASRPVDPRPNLDAWSRR